MNFYDNVEHAIAIGGTGTLTLGAAAANRAGFPAGADGKSVPYVIATSAGAVLETGTAVYTHSGTTISSRQPAGGGSPVDVATSDTLFLDITAQQARRFDLAVQSGMPGGRLTLTPGDALGVVDVVGATTLYYTPDRHNVVPLWDGAQWMPVEFAEISVALGTLAASRNYDVFAYLSTGALALEFTSWTNDTTRATTVTMQDGRMCKSGDKTRLYLGTFRTTSTTTTEDSRGGTTSQVGGRRFVWNLYNQRARPVAVVDKADNWSYGTNTVRQANGATGNRVEIVLGFPSRVAATVHGIGYLADNGSRAAKVAPGVDSTTTFHASAMVQGGFNAVAVSGGVNVTGGGVYAPIFGAFNDVLSAGYHAINWLEKGADGVSVFLGDNAADGQQAGLVAEVLS